jgi:transcriptional regulator with XRE-family HTH domain
LKPAELRSIRRRLGVTQAAMARSLGISLGQYGAYENGRQPIRRVVELAVRYLLHLAARR